MSATYGPCPKCGDNTMYQDRTPTPCWKCLVPERTEERMQKIEANIAKAIATGNRKQRRAAKSKGRKL